MPWTYIIGDLNKEGILITFYENELQRTNQKECRIQKVIERKGDELCVKWKEYNNLFNSWINKKDKEYMCEYFPELKSLGTRKLD